MSDPTPISDLISGGISLKQGEFAEAGLSLASCIPYIGDLVAKPVKASKIAAKIANLTSRLRKLKDKLNKLKNLLKKLEKRIAKGKGKKIEKPPKAQGGGHIKGKEPKKPKEKIAKKEEKLPWGSWESYPKVKKDGREYAQIGDRLYTHHAVDRMQPSGLGAPAGADGPGRSISPNFIEDVIQNGSTKDFIADGVERTLHTSGTVEVITEQSGKIVVTVNPFSGGK